MPCYLNGKNNRLSVARRWVFSLVFFIFIVSLNGCALLQIPGKVVEGTFGILGQVFKIIQKLPTPPPGVF